MISFTDIFKKSFLEGYANVNHSIYSVSISLCITALLALYVFFVYRVVTRKTFYSKSFNISLAGVAVITAAIILTVQSSVVISLGMVGALSIVRFRTAIKDPIDLMFLFWSISIGIICGAGLSMIAIILSVFLTIGIIVLNAIPVAKSPMVLIINAKDIDLEDQIMEIVKKYTKYASVKSRNIANGKADITVELRTSKGKDLVQVLTKVDGIFAVSLLNHNGEVSF